MIPEEDAQIARAYANVIFELAGQMDATDQVLAELEQFQSVLDGLPLLKRVLTSPAISHKAKAWLTEQVVAGRVHDFVARFLAFLAASGRMRILGPVIQQYRKVIDRHVG
ncbi:MAG: F0F1 ATP synthase subunit delta [Sedimentisphaerales bacterium]|jgi:F0F1-type ATP synthase delta subunit|nr:F0F1 ATP synthase subunit delta [Sedimentisphaerales bacterium]